MSDVYQIAAIGMVDAKQRLEAISTNAASASLPGYRRHLLVGRTFDAALAASAADAGSHDEPGASPLAHVDLRPGALIATGRALDLSIDTDDAFFALTDGEQTWLTRAGAFRVNEEGQLTGERGLRVLGVQGEIHLPGTDVTVDADGRILFGDEVAGTLQLFRPSDRAALRAGPGALLVAGGLEPVAAGAARVRSGAMEASNTDAGREMIGLMMLSRQFEGLSRMVQSYDELLGQTIQKLGES